MMSSDDANPPAPPASPPPPAPSASPESPAPAAQPSPPGRPTRSTAQVLRAAMRRRNLGHGLFWSWNAIFILVTGFGILPYCLVDLLVEAGNGLLPWNLVASALLVVLIPPTATILGILFWRHEPERLFAFFYGVEAPLFLLALMRLFLIRELMPGLGLVLLLMGVSSTVYVLGLLEGDEGAPEMGGMEGMAGRAAGSAARAARLTVGAIIRLVGGSVCLAVGLYAGALLAFYAVPAGWGLIKGFFSFEWLRALWHALRYSGGLVAVYMLPGLVLFFYSATLFVMLPFVMLPLYVRCWWRLRRAAAARVGAAVSWGVTAAVLVGQVGLFVVANWQPQRAALALIAEPPKSDVERRARLGEAEAIRAGLLNAYLAPYRYISTAESDPGSDGNVRRLYRDTLHLGDAWGERVERLFAVVARPLLFEGQAQPGERAEAARRYAEFFDVPLQKGEKDRVLHALESTYNRDDREAGLLSEGERKVWVARQEVGVVEHGDWAEVELHEVYENRTPQQQELFYYFSLPETAAVVGLWLGESEDRSKAFVYTLAPRGAAQQVYRQEVQRRVDPALLEQVGPRQYRLRAFPVPPRRVVRDSRLGVAQVPRVEDGQRLHLWLRYRTVAAGVGPAGPGAQTTEAAGWPLPALAQERNVYRDKKTVRELRGRPLVLDPAVWLPARAPVEQAATPKSHRVQLDEGLAVEMMPVGKPQQGTALPRPGKRYAVVLDRSRSMGARAEEVKSALGWLGQTVVPGNQVDLYLTAAASRGEPPTRLEALAGFDAGAVIYYGGQNPGEMLDQFEALRGGRGYDAILVLTDAGSLDLADDKRPSRDLGAPLWMVHLGGALPVGYDDATLETMQRRGGGAVTRVEEAFMRLSVAEAHAGDADFLGVADGYVWAARRGVAAAGGDGDAAEAGLGALGTRVYLAAATRNVAGASGGAPSGAPGSDRLALLDQAHALARRHGVVTPYSSMIVLIDDRQRQALKEAEAKADRFQREVESGEKALPTPPGGGFGDLTGAPEPEEWALIGLTAAGLGYVAWRRRRGGLAPAG